MNEPSKNEGRKSPRRPRVICHIMSSIDGRISGAFMADPQTRPAQRKYAELQASYEADGIAYGATTTREFVGEKGPKLPTYGVVISEGDYVAEGARGPFYVSIDPAGTIAWESGTFERPGRPAMHVIEVLDERAPLAYRVYLKRCGVSYVIAGRGPLDVRLATEKLSRLFGIDRPLVCGGGVVDWTFLQAGVIDEVSLVIAPVVDGSRSVATSFDESDYVTDALPRPLALDRIERLDGGAVRLVYMAG